MAWIGGLVSVKKYELTDECIEFSGIKLYRIKALCSFGNVKEGDLGGFVGSEKNLSQDGSAWIYDDAKVFNNAVVCGRAKVSGNAAIYDNAMIYENAKVYHDAIVCGHAKIYGGAIIYDHVIVGQHSEVYENAGICGHARVYGNSKIHGCSLISEASEVCGNANISGDVYINGCCKIGDDADIQKSSDYAYIKGFGREARNTTFFRAADKSIKVVCGCFYGDIESFRSKVKKTHGDSKYAKEYLMIADLMELHFKEE